jgi:hypothetical protein
LGPCTPRRHFLIPVTARATKPMGPNSNFTPTAFAHFGDSLSGDFCTLQYTFLNLGACALFLGLNKGLSPWTQTQNFTPTAFAHFGPT